MKFNSVDLKQKALDLKQKLKDPETHAKAKELGSKTIDYVKENPSDVFLGIMTFVILDIEDSLEDIEDSSELSAYTDASTFLNRS
jgi:hypothetical protein